MEQHFGGLGCIQHDFVKVKELLKRGMNPSGNNRSLLPLHLACAFGDLDIVVCLLDHGADVNSFGERWLSPIHVAAYNNHLEVAKVLKARGAKISYAGTVSPLHLAAGQGHIKMVHFLLESGSNPNSGDEKGASPLHYTSSFLQPEAAAVLLQFGANPNAKDNDRFSPLIYLLRHECALPDDNTFYWHENCDTKLVQFLYILLENGLVLGPDVCTYTTEFLHSETSATYSRCLLQYDFDSDSDLDYDAWNYDLHVATDNGHLAAVQCLLKAGMKFEKSEWFMDDEWLTEDIDYDPESMIMVTSWCKWRFLAGMGPPTTHILNKVLESCEKNPGNNIGMIATLNAEDQVYINLLKKAVLEAKANAQWVIRSSASPRTLFFICISEVRALLLTVRSSCNIFPVINQLPVPETVKNALKFTDLPPQLKPLDTETAGCHNKSHVLNVI